MKGKILNIIKIFLYIIFLTIYFFSVFVKNEFGDVSFEQILFNIMYSKGANPDVIYNGIFFVFWRVGLISIIIYLLKLLIKEFKINICFKFNINNKTKEIKLLKERFITSFFCLIIIGYYTLGSSFKLLSLDEYIKNQNSTSEIFEKYYVDAKEVNIKFPDKKRNLIYIYAESIESSNISRKNGGMFNTSLIPNLESLALENINFSNTNKIGGAIELNNTNWTIASIIAQTSGVPLNVPINMFLDDENKLSLNNYNLGQILKDNGYSNYFMIGSDANYGARKDYLINSNYEIYDYVWAKKENLIDENYFVWWGYEDRKLFSFAKEKLLEISKENEPFNFTLLTVDTHVEDGYMDESCKKVFDNEYANALYCSDKKIHSFINWIKKQDFYDNTTIIIAGDHLTMQTDFYDVKDKSKRTIYNVFINSAIEPKKEKNRLFSTFDMYPTTLSSLGVEIDENKLGLGVNLFSDEETLLERFGVEYINSEISKKSNFYNNKILNIK